MKVLTLGKNLLNSSIFHMCGFQRRSCTLNSVEKRVWQNFMKSIFTLKKAKGP